MTNSYIINNKEYTREQLLNFATEQLKKNICPDWEIALYRFISEWFSEDEFIVIKTSGSTGTPKEITLSKQQMVYSAKRSLEFFNIPLWSTALMCLPVQYIAGMMMVIRAFTGKLNLFAISPQQINYANIPESIEFAAMVPLQIENILNQTKKIEKIKKIILGGSPISQTICDKLINVNDGEAWETYGMTETITHVAVRKITASSIQGIFSALPGITFTTDSRNCLVITDPLLHTHNIVTNDCVDLLSPSKFRLNGRADNIINTGGIKIWPEEIENILSGYLNDPVCISSLPDEKLGNRLVLVVKNGTNLVLLNKAIETLAPYQRPKQIVEMPELPQNNNGKIDRTAIKAFLNMQQQII